MKKSKYFKQHDLKLPCVIDGAALRNKSDAAREYAWFEDVIRASLEVPKELRDTVQGLVARQKKPRWC